MPKLAVLDVSRTGVSGPIPSELGLIDTLEIINFCTFCSNLIRFCQSTIFLRMTMLILFACLYTAFCGMMSGPLPSELGNIADLEELLLGKWRFHGNY
jgi:hypothetical protein